MRLSGGPASAASVAAAVIASLTAACPAQASGDDWALNGTYTATSNGEWARTNEVFHDEASIRSTWTISTTCSYPTECTGKVTSDQGWSADIYAKSGIWYVKRALANWEPCPDGTAATGLQIYRFWPADQDTRVTPGSTTLIGEDNTTGVSGACGHSLPLNITMPFKLVKVG